MNKLFITFSSLALLTISQITNAAAPDTLWTKAYGGTNDDVGYSVAETLDSGFIVVGTTYTFGAGNGDVYVIRTNSSGDTLWTKTFGGTLSDMGYSVSKTLDKGFIIAGTIASPTSGCDVYLVRIDSTGDTVWTRAFGGINSDYGAYASGTSDSGFVATGKTFSFGAGSCDAYLVKTNSSGDTSWTRTFGGTAWDEGSYVSETPDSGFIIVGKTESSGAGMGDVYLAKTNSHGDSLWAKTFGGTGEDYGTSLSETPDSGFIVTGCTQSFGAGNADVYLIRTKPSGDTLWTKTFGGTHYDAGYSISKTSDSGFIIGGTTASSGAGSWDFYLIKINPSGSAVWTKTVGGTNTDEGCSALETQDKGIVITGTTNSFGIGTTAYSNVYLVKIKPEVGIEESTNPQSPTPNPQLQISRNPFRSNTIISYSLPFTIDCLRLTICDVSGRTVKTLINELKPAGAYTLNFDAKDLPSGIYFAELKAGNYRETKKLVLMK